MPKWVYRPLHPQQQHRDVNVVVPAVSTGPQTIFPDSIASDEAWGTHQLNFILFPDSTESNEAFCALTIVSIITPTSFGSDESWGGLQQIIQTIFPDSIDSNEGWEVLDVILPSAANPGVMVIMSRLRWREGLGHQTHNWRSRH